MQIVTEPKVTAKCHHCGDLCLSEHIEFDNHDFCCQGCRAVYELFQGTELTSFYNNRTTVNEGTYDYLKEPEFANEFIVAKTKDFSKVVLNLPAIHCSACIYVLENLSKIDAGITRVTINFGRKTAEILFRPEMVSLPELCRLLAAMGYPPDLSRRKKKEKSSNRTLSLQIGVAGFCFGNIMLLSFPEYLGIDMDVDMPFTQFFGYLSILLSLPILFYSGSQYFISAYKGLKMGFINIDIPIALGMLVLFVRSNYEIVYHVGAGYLDSLAGLVFFLLLGKWFQGKTYENLSFERDYNSYFPLSVALCTESRVKNIPIKNLKISDRIIVRNQEVIPADAILLSNSALIDYSFVTGEETPIAVNRGEVIYAGGRVLGEKVKLETVNKSSQSYLTSLWNNQVFKDEKHASTQELTNKISKHFTLIILSIATVAGVSWLILDPSKVWQVVTAILIVACPCALALSAPFTNGNTIRILGRRGFYLKKASVAEHIPEIDTIIFDKTGTITNQHDAKINFVGNELTKHQLSVIKAMVSNSNHPLSKTIHNSIAEKETAIKNFREEAGNGICAEVEGKAFKLGSANWVGVSGQDETIKRTRIYVSVESETKGYFEVKNSYRPGLQSLVNALSVNRELMVLSGDNDSEKSALEDIFPYGTNFIFNQTPKDKLKIIASLQNSGRKVMMLGDGLNDAGALKQSDVGIAITDDTGSFSPACDGILEGSKLKFLNKFLSFSQQSRWIIYSSFGLSFLYNIGGITVAIMGLMTPIFAAILMPLSSISVVLFTTFSGNYFAKKLNL